jgi:ATP-dependent DNA helicase DinG
MLSDEQKKQIQHAYSQWLDSHGFKPRYGQRLMIAEIAKALNASDGERYAAIEAGTGIGKTVSYTLAAVPAARARDRKLIFATATVALQEQLVHKDLPDLIEHSGMDFSFALAKGRGRYLCLSKLETILNGAERQSDFGALYPDEQFAVDNAPPIHIYEQMMSAYASGEWSGDRDDWPQALDDQDWRVLTSDRSQCHNRRCAYISDCCFFKARENLDEVDCVVTNHDMVLADLALGGGAVLPEPEESIYVFDEAHHLADKAVQHFSSSLRLFSTARWLGQLASFLEQLCEDWSNARSIRNNVAQVMAISGDLDRDLHLLPEYAQRHIDVLTAQGQESRAYGGRPQQYRFQQGQIEPELKEMAGQCQRQFQQLESHLSAISESMQEALEAKLHDDDETELEQWYPVVGAALNRAGNAAELVRYFMLAGQESTPRAYWISHIEFDNGMDYGFHSAPLLAADYLQDLLWQRCDAALMTSATLTALGSFERLKMRAGLPDEAKQLLIPSPFDYANNAVLRLPRQACNPSEVEAHTDAVIEYIEQIDDKSGVLVLFSSRKQMREVHDNLSSALSELVLLQDDRSKQALLTEHKKRIDNGERSFIFGLASFAEGVDLPGDYCRHVVIAKIPFAVPDDPVEASLAEWVEERGGNAFMEISVPDAALKLVQACGRLIRAENDTGVVAILDNRLMTRRYGEALLQSLPPFKREFMEQ